MLIPKKTRINENDWFVTLHIRRSEKTITVICEMLTLQLIPKQLKKIIDNGGKVIKVGDRIWRGKNLTKFNKINGLIDYPFTNKKTNLWMYF